jgi:virginiamycin B lyase
MDRRYGIVGVAVALGAAIGCDARPLAPGIGGMSGGTADEVPPCGLGVSVTEILLKGGTPALQPYSITAGADGNLWLTEVYVNAIGRLSTDGSLVSFPLPSPSLRAQGIGSGPDGNVWFAEAGGQNGGIGRITPDGTIKEFPLPDTPSSTNRWPSAVIAGPDGSIWFADPTGNNIGRMSLDGVLLGDTFLSTTSDWRDTPSTIALAADGNFWFGEVNRVGRMTPAGDVTFYPLHPDEDAGGAGDIISGPDGNLWRNGPSLNRLQRILLPAADDSQLEVAEFFPPGYNPGTPPAVGPMVVGPDGNIWFMSGSNAVCATTAGRFHQIAIPSGFLGFAITVGPDGALWFTEPSFERVGRISFN